MIPIRSPCGWRVVFGPRPLAPPSSSTGNPFSIGFQPAFVLSRRRAVGVLGAAAVTGIAGCLSSIVPNPGTSGEPAVSFSADVLHPFADTQPGRIELEFSNAGGRTLLYLPQESPGQPGMFRTVRGSHRTSNAELLLLRPGAIDCRTDAGTPAAIPETPPDRSAGDGCWRPPCEDLVLYHVMPAWRELAPNDPVRGEYVLLDGFNDTCLPAGTYDFTETGRIAAGAHSEGGEPRFDCRRYEIERKLSVTIDETLDVTVSTAVTISNSRGPG